MAEDDGQQCSGRSVLCGGVAKTISVVCGAQAQQKMAELQGNKLENLSEITATPTSQLKFITDAWCQVRASCSEL